MESVNAAGNPQLQNDRRSDIDSHGTGDEDRRLYDVRASLYDLVLHDRGKIIEVNSIS